MFHAPDDLYLGHYEDMTWKPVTHRSLVADRP